MKCYFTKQEFSFTEAKKMLPREAYAELVGNGESLPCSLWMGRYPWAGFLSVQVWSPNEFQDCSARSKKSNSLAECPTSTTDAEHWSTLLQVGAAFTTSCFRFLLVFTSRYSVIWRSLKCKPWTTFYQDWLNAHVILAIKWSLHPKRRDVMEAAGIWLLLTCLRRTLFSLWIEVGLLTF